MGRGPGAVQRFALERLAAIYEEDPERWTPGLELARQWASAPHGYLATRSDIESMRRATGGLWKQGRVELGGGSFYVPPEGSYLPYLKWDPHKRQDLTGYRVAKEVHVPEYTVKRRPVGSKLPRGGTIWDSHKQEWTVPAYTFERWVAVPQVLRLVRLKP
jgi:hypothetical protein